MDKENVDKATARGKRRFSRYDVAVPLAITLFRPSAGVRVRGRSNDLGEGGLRASVTGNLRVGERVELAFALPSATKRLHMRAVVRHYRDLICGFEFLSLESNQRDLLRALDERARLGAVRTLNLQECRPGDIVPVKSATVICASCGSEYPQDENFCFLCGTPQAFPPLIEEDVKPPSTTKVFHQSYWMPTFRFSRKYRSTGRTGREALFDTVVALIFLFTFVIGLWQWLNAPAQSSAHGPLIDVQIADVFPVLPAAPNKADNSSSSSPDFFSRPSRGRVQRAIIKPERPSVVEQFFAPSSTSSRANGPVGQPGSAAFEPRKPSTYMQPSAPLTGSTRLKPGQISTAPATARQSSQPNVQKPSALLTTKSAADNSQTGVNSGPTQASPAALAKLLLQKVSPVYPSRAQAEGVQGQVILWALIGKDGRIAELRSVRGPHMLRGPAMAAVRQWRFKPYELNGAPVEVETDIRLNFALPQE